MKRFILLLIIVIQFFGCGGSSSNENTKMVKNLVNKEVYFSLEKEKLINHAKYFELIEDQETLDNFIEKINHAIYQDTDSNLSHISINFEKYHILVYYTKYNAGNQLDEYKEEISIKDTEHVKIEQIFTGHIKDEDEYFGRALQLRLYQIDKNIKFVEMVHEDEITEVALDDPHPKNKKFFSFFVHGQGSGEKMEKVFDNNETYQEFLDNYKLTCYPKESYPKQIIDFKNYRVLLRVVHVGYGNLDRIDEQISVSSLRTAKIIDRYIHPKDMSTEKREGAEEYDFLIYLVDREIKSVEIEYEYRDSITIDMRE